MSTPLVTIMMPAYNAERHIGLAIESVLSQTYAHWELIIVEDGSSDDTAQIAAQFSDPRIQVIHQPNEGESAARNTALEHVRGELLAFLDADDLYLSNHLELAVNYLRNHPHKDAVYTDGYHCDQNGNRLQTLSNRRRGPFEGRIFEEVVRGSDVFGPPVCVVLSAHIIKRHHLQFDTDIVIGPDWDFFIHYADLARFGYLDHHTCLYRVHQANITARIDLQKRALELAKCRANAIKMKNFGTCSLGTRWTVFYDLLINLLRDYPERQTVITQWPEFCSLPHHEQARLFRLMASTSAANGGEPKYIIKWLRCSRKLNPADRRGALLSAIYHLSPFFCKLLLRARRMGQTDPLHTPPFADLERAGSV